MDEKFYITENLIPPGIVSDGQNPTSGRENVTSVFIEDNVTGRHQIFRMSRQQEDQIEIEFNQFEEDTPFKGEW